MNDIVAGLLFFVCIIVVVLIVAAVQESNRQRILTSGIGEIDRMPGTSFERYLVAVFRHLGHQVQHTGRVGDYGADLVIVRDGERTIVQAKRWNRKVGVKAVQEAVAAKGMYGCTAAMVVTNSFYTEQAKTLARANHVELWDRQQLIRMLQQLSALENPSTAVITGEPGVDAPVASYQPNTSPAAVARCQHCGVAVSDKVLRYCEANSARFKGAIYCYDHQRGRPASVPTG